MPDEDIIVLDHSFELFIPTQCICGKNIEPNLREKYLELVKGRLHDWFGGATVKPVNGIWKLPDGTIADERVDIIESLSSQEAYEDYFDDVKNLAVEVADRLSQDRVLLKVDGKGFLFARSDINAQCHHNEITPPTNPSPVFDEKDTFVSIYYSLAKFSSTRDARDLFCNTLNYKMVSSELPSYDKWPTAVRSLLRESPEIIANTNGFKIIYLHLAADGLRRGAERQIVQRIYQEDPSFCGLFVVSDAPQETWEFVSAKNQDDGTRKLLLRRMHVGTEYVRTATERIALVKISEAEETTITASELQVRHDAAFDVSAVTKQFYRELSDWYFWAQGIINFPDDLNQGEEVCKAENTIRLITRLIFVWFLKEKGLVPDTIFDPKALATMLDHSKDETHSTYYRAILQNLFFATLNVPMNERVFRVEKRFKGINKDYMNHRVYRYAELFENENSFERIFAEIPFLNGGLFDCLDYMDDDGKEVRIDCFSDNPKNARQLVVPDSLFFGGGVVDLSEIYQDQRRNNVIVRGIINILKRYNFTLEEHTPVEEEIALDPELLGRVFENLLASYNPETMTTARKQTGSFYTPREIVSYMVDESLQVYLMRSLVNDERSKEKIAKLLEYSDEPLELTETETDQIIGSLEDAKIVDPACGSGAFPMGILQKMVYILEKLDPNNERWKQTLLKRTPAEVRGHIEQLLEANTTEYIRKLIIIQNCIYGVDIQPIAIQISKLRFFISLLVDSKVDRTKWNYGIQPLPNLDYKLMQGNSLVEDFYGFTLNFREQDSVNGAKLPFSENAEVEPLIKDLWEKQSEYLQESRPTRKERLQKEVESDIIDIFDTYIRLKKAPYFAELNSLVAKANRLPNERTREEYLSKEKRKLDRRYNFNPISIEIELKEFTRGHRPRNFFPWQLYFADVFKKKGGFDIVIGNPPYISAIEFNEIYGSEIRATLNGLFESARGTYDIFILFMEKGIKLLSQGGLLTFITPNKYLAAKYGAAFREFISRNSSIRQVTDLSAIRVFEEAAVYPIISVITAEIRNNDVTVLLPKRNGLDSFNKNYYDFTQIPNNLLNLLPEKIWGFLLSRHVGLLPKMISGSRPLARFGKINATSTAAEADTYSTLISEGGKGKDTKIINTGTIDRYRSLWGTEYLTHSGSRYLKPYLRVGSESVSERRRLMYRSPKIVFAKMAKECEAFVDLEGEYASVNTNCFYDVAPDANLCYVAAFCNSKIFTFIYSLFFGALRMSGGYYQFQAPSLRVIPVKVISKTQQQPFVELVKRIVAATKDNPGVDTSDLEDKINELFYDLYDLKDDEIKIVEGSV